MTADRVRSLEVENQHLRRMLQDDRSLLKAQSVHIEFLRRQIREFKMLCNACSRLNEELQKIP